MSDSKAPSVAEIVEDRYRFFSDRGVSLTFELDKVLITLFTGIVAGLLALLVTKEVGFWSTVFFVLADLAAVIGLACCLMHMTFGAKVMAGMAAIYGGDEEVPHLITKSEPTIHAINRNRLYAQVCYPSQLTCLFWSVCLAGLGIVAMVWHVIGWIGLFIALFFAAGLIVATFRPLLILHRFARRALSAEPHEEPSADIEGDGGDGACDSPKI